jgi:hypothetical protein
VPDDRITNPDDPDVDTPDPMRTAPEDPDDVVPDDSTIAPLLPPTVESPVATDNDPVAASDVPEDNTTEPLEAPRALPLANDNEPLLPLDVVPELNRMPPEVPAVSTFVERIVNEPVPDGPDPVPMTTVPPTPPAAVVSPPER